MCDIATLESIAVLLVRVPDQSVERLLVNYDALVGVSDADIRPHAAQLLRDAATSCADAPRRERLIRAAEAVAAGERCARARAVTVAAPGHPPDQEEEAPDVPRYMDAEPPELPHLRVPHFFPGLVVRVGRDLTDAYGRTLGTGELLYVLVCEREEDGYAVTFLDRNILLRDTLTGQHAAIENLGNAWFQPVPTHGCLEDLLQAIDLRMGEAEDDEVDSEVERLDLLGEDIERCGEWLSLDAERGPAPDCTTGSLAARIFGRDHDLAVWIPLLFEALPVCLPDL